MFDVSYILGFYLALLATPIDWAQSTSGAGDHGPQYSYPAAAPLEDFERRIGPLKMPCSASPAHCAGILTP
jgi:hypothetical protein